MCFILQNLKILEIHTIIVILLGFSSPSCSIICWYWGLVTIVHSANLSYISHLIAGLTIIPIDAMNSHAVTLNTKMLCWYFRELSGSWVISIWRSKKKRRQKKLTTSSKHYWRFLFVKSKLLEISFDHVFANLLWSCSNDLLNIISLRCVRIDGTILQMIVAE